ncbi:MAG: toprim domain-containing protein [Methanotrichaceae archaeon]|nr:toprim domain-containing protein [Methanotrichaceae archaeon]
MRPEPRLGRAKGTYDLDALEEQITSLLDASKRGAAIIVEGLRDKRALRSLGAEGPVIMASRRPSLDLAEEAAREYEEIIVLTDWDRQGEEMARKIQHHLQATSVPADLDIRERLKRLVRKEIKDVESLDNYVRRMREQSGP